MTFAHAQMTIEAGFSQELPSDFRWATSHQEYIWAVDYYLAQALEIRETLLREYASLGEDYVAYHRGLQAATASAQLFACIAVEAAVNLCLVIRIGRKKFNNAHTVGGKKFQKAERWPLPTKLKELVALAGAGESTAFAPTLQAVERLVEARNDLAHPKAAVLELDEHLEYASPPTIIAATTACADMHCALNFLSAIDPHMFGLLL